ncbi:MAG: hypothetical protein ACI4J6_02425 [Oscillospiraceae bacterium]
MRKYFSCVPIWIFFLSAFFFGVLSPLLFWLSTIFIFLVLAAVIIFINVIIYRKEAASFGNYPLCEIKQVVISIVLGIIIGFLGFAVSLFILLTSAGPLPG